VYIIHKGYFHSPLAYAFKWNDSQRPTSISEDDYAELAARTARSSVRRPGSLASGEPEQEHSAR